MTRSPTQGASAEATDRHFASNLQEPQETQVSLLIIECVLGCSLAMTVAPSRGESSRNEVGP
jgi:hypothetical protein